MGNNIIDKVTECRDRMHKYLRKEGVVPTLESYLEWEFDNLYRISTKKVQQRVAKRAEEQGISKYAYVKKHIAFFRILDEFWDTLGTDISRQMIIQRGREVGDGFIGITLKKAAYANRYVVEVCNGSTGTFIKTYFKMPSKEQIKCDIEMRLSNNDLLEKDVGASVVDIWREMLKAKEIEDTQKYVTYTSVLHLRKCTANHRVGDVVILNIEGVPEHSGKYIRVKKEKGVDWGLNGWKKIE